MRQRHWISLWLVVLLFILAGGAVLLRPAQAGGSRQAPHIPFLPGDVFAAVGNGQVGHYSPNGSFIETLFTGAVGQFETGMCFDSDGNLYVTNWSGSSMSKFNRFGLLVTYPWGGPFTRYPESCVADATNNIYTGEVDGAPSRIRKFDPNGTLLASHTPLVSPRGTDWIDLAADQCTMYYTSEGRDIRRYNVCTSTQLPDFVNALPAQACYALRLRANGEVMVACTNMAIRLSPGGAILQTYPTTNYPGASIFFAANLDPDGTSYWTADFQTGHIYKINIATGALLLDFIAPPLSASLGGLAVYGEFTQAQPTATVTPTPSITPTASNTPTATRTATAVPKNTHTPTAPPVPTNTATRTATPVPKNTHTPTAVPTATATAPPLPTSTCGPQTPTRVPTLAFTPAPGCTDRPRSGDLRATITDHPATTDALFTNRSNSCSYRIGLAIYRKFDNNIDHQELYDYRLAVIPPNSTLLLTVTNPPCAYQADAFWGDVIYSFASGVRYGERRLDDTDGGGTSWCQPGGGCPTPPAVTPTPAMPTVTAITPTPAMPTVTPACCSSLSAIVKSLCTLDIPTGRRIDFQATVNNSCAITLNAMYSVHLEVSANGMTWRNQGQTTPVSIAFPPGATTLTDAFRHQNFDPADIFYRVRLHITVNNCAVADFVSPIDFICGKTPPPHDQPPPPRSSLRR